MKILMHIDSLGSGGAQRQIVLLAIGLASRGHHVEFNVYHDMQHFRSIVEAENIPIRITTKRFRFSVSPILALVSHAKAMKADAIVAFLRTPAIYAVFSGIFLRKCRVITSERFCFSTDNVTKKVIAFQQANRLADAITVNSKVTRNDMVSQFPWIKTKIYTIMNGYDMQKKKVGRVQEGDTLRLLSLASVNARKNAFLLAKALRICVQERNVKITVTWAGEPTIVGGRCFEKERVDMFLMRHHLIPYWRWLGPVTDTDALFTAADALIHTSKAEGFSNAIAESLVNSTPVIVGRIGDQPALVEASQAGLLFDVDDPEKIADSICEFDTLQSRELMAMRRRARAYAERNLSVEKMVDCYETLVKKICSS